MYQKNNAKERLLSKSGGAASGYSPATSKGYQGSSFKDNGSSFVSGSGSKNEEAVAKKKDGSDVFRGELNGLE